jgi:excisionase family DNA binding protein
LVEGVVQVSDREWLQISEAAARLGLGQSKTRELADSGHLRSRRPPSSGPGHSRRRIDPASVDELLAVMRMPDGPDREQAMQALVEKNRGG